MPDPEGDARGRTPSPFKLNKGGPFFSFATKNILRRRQTRQLLVIIPATSSLVERANSALRLAKTNRRGTMKDGRLTALVLLHVHRAIPIDIEQLINKYACYFILKV